MYQPNGEIRLFVRKPQVHLVPFELRSLQVKQIIASPVVKVVTAPDFTHPFIGSFVLNLMFLGR